MSLFIAVIFLSVGYASLSSSLLVSGEAHLRVKEEVRVTNLTISEQISSSYDNNSEYYKNGLILRAVLPNKDSKITYEIELTNNSSLDYYLKSAGYKSIEENNYTNIDGNTMTFEKGDFKYTIEGIKTDDTVIKPNKSTFTITITYKDGIQEVPSNNNAVIDIRYEFDILDKIPPVVSFSIPGGCYGDFQVVRVTGYDEHFNHMDIEVYKNEEKIETKTVTYPNNSYDISLNEYTEYTIYVKAYDDRGNVQKIGPQDERGYTYQKYLIEEDNGYLYDKVKTCSVSDANVDFEEQPTDEEAEQAYYLNTSKSEEYPIYYYRGPVTNNNVIFAGYCWKIVRTTETGGVKLIYSGKPTSDGKCTRTGTDQFAFYSVFNHYTVSTANKKYVGYMYGEDDNPYENKYDSKIKKNIEAWFEGKNIGTNWPQLDPDGTLNPDYTDLTKYDDYLEDAVWCNDRTESRTSGSEIYYAVYDRNKSYDNVASPSLACPSNDSFTVSIANGNGKSKHKVGMITVDELMMGGINDNTRGSNINTYIYPGDIADYTGYWYSLSPRDWTGSEAELFTIKDYLFWTTAITSRAIRPMVSLVHDIKTYTGDGTAEKPYTVEPYSESTLNGANPELGSGMIPVTIDNNGTVKYANIGEKWYSYKDKEWANAVILVDRPSKSYSIGDVIKESDIESYFVWIPRYRYQLWDLGDYTGYINGQPDKSNARTIQIKFETIGNETKDGVTGECSTPLESGDKGSCNIGDWITHPAFINMNTNGIWVGKFETGYNQNSDSTTPITDTSSWTTGNAQKDEENKDKIIVKPNVYSWRGITIGNMFKNAYNYDRNLDSHMMKNTEWGAVAYLSHSDYGIGKEVNINNNRQFKTGYSTTQNADQSSFPGTGGTSADVTQAYNTPTGYLASTTGNMTGVYDMSGGAWEYMAAYMEGYGQSNTELTEAELSTTYAKYFDKYKADSDNVSYNNRILGDATGEIGPFYGYNDRDSNYRIHNAWYTDQSLFIDSVHPRFGRGGEWDNGGLGGQFYFFRYTGGQDSYGGFRLVLATR